MEKVAILGSSFPAFSLAERLAASSTVQSIRIIDVERANKEAASFTYHHPKISLYRLKQWSSDSLLSPLIGCSSAILIVPFEPPLRHTTRQETIHRNGQIVSRVDHAIDAILRSGVTRLVYLGDAYSALPIDDNYGISEQKHTGLPTSFLLGEYGEALCRAELSARNRLAQADTPCSLFLRPVMCPSSPWFSRLLRLASEGRIPFLKGTRRGLHQTIALHNLAEIVARALNLMHSRSSALHNQLIYCMDTTIVSPLSLLLSSRSSTFSAISPSSFYPSLINHAHSQALFYFLNRPSDLLPLPTFRLLFDKTIGFTDKKQRLLLDFQPMEQPLITTQPLPLKKSTMHPLRMG